MPPPANPGQSTAMQDSSPLFTILKQWLPLVTRMVPSVEAAIAWLGQYDEDVSICWPEGNQPASQLVSAAEMALTQGSQVIVSTDDHLVIASPLRSSGQTVGTVGTVAVSIRAPASQQQALGQLVDWGCAWFEFAAGNPVTATTGALTPDPDLGRLLSLDSEELLDELTRQVTAALAAERVFIGIQPSPGAKLSLVRASHASSPDQRTNISGMALAAMQESLAVGSTTLSPGSPAQKVPADQSGSSYAVSMPLGNGGFGAITVLRGSDLGDADRAVLENLAGTYGPLLDMRHQASLGPVALVKQQLGEVLRNFLGPDYFRVKVIAAALLAVTLLLAIAEGQHEVRAVASLEGQAQQSVVAPFDGFIDEASSRAGDQVIEGQVMARLDDRETRLERQRQASEQGEIERQYRQALAAGERSDASVLQAKLDQATARLGLLDRRLSQTELRSPIHGLVLSGDLSREIGAPVKRGQLLYEISPLDDYRIVINVNETDIDEVQTGQRGVLVLASHPSEQIPFEVVSIRSVVDAQENLGVVFLTEARLIEKPAFLRPGMEGHARIAVGRRSWGWLLFHDMTDWLTLMAWRYLP